MSNSTDYHMILMRVSQLLKKMNTWNDFRSILAGKSSLMVMLPLVMYNFPLAKLTKHPITTSLYFYSPQFDPTYSVTFAYLICLYSPAYFFPSPNRQLSTFGLTETNSKYKNLSSYLSLENVCMSKMALLEDLCSISALLSGLSSITQPGLHSLKVSVNSCPFHGFSLNLRQTVPCSHRRLSLSLVIARLFTADTIYQMCCSSLNLPLSLQFSSLSILIVKSFQMICFSNYIRSSIAYFARLFMVISLWFSYFYRFQRDSSFDSNYPLLLLMVFLSCLIRKSFLCLSILE